MVKVIGVRFRTAGKIYFFDPLKFEVKRGDHVIRKSALSDLTDRFDILRERAQIASLF